VATTTQVLNVMKRGVVLCRIALTARHHVLMYQEKPKKQQHTGDKARTAATSGPYMSVLSPEGPVVGPALIAEQNFGRLPA